MCSSDLDAYTLMQQGHFERAFEKLFNAPSKPLVAYRYAEEGVKKVSGKQVMHKDDLSKWDIVSTGLGITPESVAMAQRESSNSSEKQLRLQAKKNMLLDRIWAEHLKNSPGENIARQQFYKFAAQHPGLVDDPDKTIEDSFDKKYEGLAEAAGTLGVQIQEGLTSEVAAKQYQTKRFLGAMRNKP